LFYVYFPLGAAARRKIVHKVGHYEIPEHAKPFPPLRRSMFRDANGLTTSWILSEDGCHEYVTKRLSPEQKKWSKSSIWNDTLLVDRICEGWRPEMEK
jgi:hypothetical protein